MSSQSILEGSDNKRFISGQEAYCGRRLNDGPGSIILLANTIDRKSVTCKNCLRKMQKDTK